MVYPSMAKPMMGLFSPCSSRLGEVIRDNYKMNHMDSVNQVFGIVSLLDTNPLTVYRKPSQSLKRSIIVLYAYGSFKQR